MKKRLLLCLAALLCLSACSLQMTEDEEPFSAAFTIRPPESLTEVYYDIPLSTENGEQPGTTLPDADHTLRLEDLRGLMTQSVFGENADATVCLWQKQICYTLEGSFTEEDRAALTGMAQTLVQISPFPGMRETTADSANVTVHFTDTDKAQFTCTTDANGVITSGQITIPSSLPTWQRSALLEEKMFRLFGFPNAVQTPLESVLAQKPASTLTEADLIVLETVYGHMQPGMTQTDAVNAFTEAFITQ